MVVVLSETIAILETEGEPVSILTVPEPETSEPASVVEIDVILVIL